MWSIVPSEPNVWAGKGPLILASGSSSRRVLLTAAGLAAQVVCPRIDERLIEERYLADGGSIDGLAVFLARAKAIAVSLLRKQAFCLGADQTLTLGDNLLHKPLDLAQAARSLAKLAGRTHRLTSAFCVARAGKTMFEASDTAKIRMRALDIRQIAQYLELAGPSVLSSVGIYQLEGFGVHLFDRVDGDHTTVMGLPMLKLLSWLRCQGLIVT